MASYSDRSIRHALGSRLGGTSQLLAAAIVVYTAGTVIAYVVAGSITVFLLMWAFLAWMPSGGLLAAARIRREDDEQLARSERPSWQRRH